MTSQVQATAARRGRLGDWRSFIGADPRYFQTSNVWQDFRCPGRTGPAGGGRQRRPNQRPLRTPVLPHLLLQQSGPEHHHHVVHGRMGAGHQFQRFPRPGPQHQPQCLCAGPGLARRRHQATRLRLLGLPAHRSPQRPACLTLNPKIHHRENQHAQHRELS